MKAIFTKHALDRMAEMEVTQAQVEDLLGAPDLTYPSTRLGVTRSISSADRHGFAVVHAATVEGDQVVVTVVHRVEETYIRQGASYQLVDPQNTKGGPS